MPVGSFHSVGHMTMDIYRLRVERVYAGEADLARLMFHTAWRTDGGSVLSFDVWADRVAMDRFEQEQLLPALRDVKLEIDGWLGSAGGPWFEAASVAQPREADAHRSRGPGPRAAIRRIRRQLPRLLEGAGASPPPER